MHKNERFVLSRSQFIKAMIGAAVAFPAAQKVMCQTPLVRVEHPLVPVIVNPARVIRTIVGLRPFRASGFVLNTEKFGSKTLVHNYGHGGGGVSLSWGCAMLAADLVTEKTPAKAAVIGCGVIGLSTARILQDRGWEVTIYTEKVPPDTTSNVAGAQWKPTMVCHYDEVSQEFLNVYQKAARLSNRAFQLLVGPTYGVRWIDNYTLANEPESEIDMQDSETTHGLSDLYADNKIIDPASTPFSYKYVRRYSTMLIEPNTYLPAIMRDFLLRSGKICVRKFEHKSDLQKLHEHVIFNCTGLGAGALFDDKVIEPIRGQLTFLEPQSDVNYIAFADDIYMFPRSDGILLGGTYEHSWSLEPDIEKEKQILAKHAAIFRT